MISRLGILGGMFDPVHNGHLEAARFAVQKLQLDQLRMIPCHLPNHRDSAVSDTAHRLSMLELATAQEPAIEVDPIEINRNRISYTVDTLTEMLRIHTRASLVFVLGVDSFNTLPQWHHWSKLFDLCHFMVLARPGSTLAPALGDVIDVGKRMVAAEEELFRCKSGNIYLATDFENDISSTEIRNTLTAHEDVSALLPREVIDYIRDYGLYD